MARPKKLPVFLDDEEKERLLKQPNPRYLTGERNKILLEFILQTGTRLSETIDIKWSHINLMTGKLLIIEGKGGKDRMLYIDNSLIEKLQKWKERQADEIGRCEYVFTTAKGDQLKPRYVQTMVKRYTQKAGIDKDISPHKLRHTFATDYYKETQNILNTMKLLGHSNLSTTMIYTHVVDDELEESMKAFQRNRNSKDKGQNTK